MFCLNKQLVSLCLFLAVLLGVGFSTLSSMNRQIYLSSKKKILSQFDRVMHKMVEHHIKLNPATGQIGVNVEGSTLYRDGSKRWWLNAYEDKKERLANVSENQIINDFVHTALIEGQQFNVSIKFNQETKQIGPNVKGCNIYRIGKNSWGFGDYKDQPARLVNAEENQIIEDFIEGQQLNASVLPIKFNPVTNQVDLGGEGCEIYRVDEKNWGLDAYQDQPAREANEEENQIINNFIIGNFLLDIQRFELLTLELGKLKTRVKIKVKMKKKEEITLPFRIDANNKIIHDTDLGYAEAMGVTINIGNDSFAIVRCGNNRATDEQIEAMRNELTCPICSAYLVDALKEHPSNDVTILSCGHIGHKHCFMTYFDTRENIRCPLCNKVSPVLNFYNQVMGRYFKSVDALRTTLRDLIVARSYDLVEDALDAAGKYFTENDFFSFITEEVQESHQTLMQAAKEYAPVGENEERDEKIINLLYAKAAEFLSAGLNLDFIAAQEPEATIDTCVKCRKALSINVPEGNVRLRLREDAPKVMTLSCTNAFANIFGENNANGHKIHTNCLADLVMNDDRSFKDSCECPYCLRTFPMRAAFNELRDYMLDPKPDPVFTLYPAQLLFAARGKNLAEVKRLLDKAQEAKNNEQITETQWKEFVFVEGLHGRNIVDWAVANDDAAMVKLFLDSNFLAKAIKLNKIGMVLSIVSAAKKYLTPNKFIEWACSIKDDDENTILTYAIWCEDINIFQMIFSEMKEAFKNNSELWVSFLCKQNKYKSDILMLSAERRNLEIFQMIFSEIKEVFNGTPKLLIDFITESHGEGLSLMSYILDHGDLKMLEIILLELKELFLRKPALLVDFINKLALSSPEIFINLIEKDCVDILRIFFSIMKEGLNGKFKLLGDLLCSKYDLGFKGSLNSLMVAANGNRSALKEVVLPLLLEIKEWLIDNPKILVDLFGHQDIGLFRDSDGWTALMHVINSNKSDKIKAFLSVMQELFINNQHLLVDIFTKKNRSGDNALMIAVETDNTDILKIFLAEVRQVFKNKHKLLINFLNQKNNEGATALMMAEKKDNKEMVELLTEAMKK